jgi:hypothetical protein
MKTTSSVVNLCSRTFARYASLVAIGAIALALACTQPVLAQTDGGFTPDMSIEHHGLPTASHPGDPWAITPPSLADQALASAPTEPVEPPMPQPRGGFMPGRVGGLYEPLADPAIPVTSPMLTVPAGSMSMPSGGLYSPVR